MQRSYFLPEVTPFFYPSSKTAIDFMPRVKTLTAAYNAEVFHPTNIGRNIVFTIEVPGSCGIDYS